MMKSRRRYNLNENVFDIINTKEKAYWLGYLYCDGGVDKHNNLTLWSKDKDQISKFQRFLKTNRPIEKVVMKQRSGKICTYSVQTIRSKHIVQSLARYGIIPNKTYDHSVSIYIPKGKLERHFWRGCVDGDGHVGLYGRYYIQSISGKKKRYGPYLRGALTLTNNNINLLNKCKGFFKKGTIRKHMWQVTDEVLKTVTPLLDLIYKSTPENIRLERKYQKYLEMKQCV